MRCAYLVFHVIHHHKHLLHEVGEILAVREHSREINFFSFLFIRLHDTHIIFAHKMAKGFD